MVISKLRWTSLACLLTLPVAAPMVAIGLSLFQDTPEAWVHLRAYVLPQATLNSIFLCAAVGAICLILGSTLAWLISRYRFMGRGFFQWALVLPMAVPGYVAAVAMIGLFDFSGPVGQLLHRYGLPELPIRTGWGAALILSLSLYPYVYLIARSVFKEQGQRAIEVGQSLGYSKRQSFIKIVIPFCRPALAAGTVLVMMESLADFGTVSAFNFDTLSTAIYKAWFQYYSLEGALRLASALLLFATFLIVLEKVIRRRQSHISIGKSELIEIQLSGGKSLLAAIYCLFILSFGFLIPVAQLSIWAIQTYAAEVDGLYMARIWHSVGLGGIVALTVCAVALLISYAKRHAPGPVMNVTQQLATIGYAVPGTVLAVGIVTPLALLNTLVFTLTGQNWLLQSGLFALVVALGVRLLAVAHGPVDAKLSRIPFAIDEVLRGQGYSPLKRLRIAHLPMLKSTFGIAVLMVFVDTVKEMPITLMMRPFGWDTLAVRVFELTSEGEWERAALPSLSILLISLIPVLLLNRKGATHET